MTMRPTQHAFKHIVAFEVAKHELVIHSLPSDEQAQIANTAKDIRRRLKTEMKNNKKQRYGAMLVVCEATGGYERQVLDVCMELGLSVHRAHGSRVRFFAKYLGLAKTDPIDARVLALYGARSENLHLYEAPSHEERVLQRTQGSS